MERSLVGLLSELLGRDSERRSLISDRRKLALIDLGSVLFCIDGW